MLGCLKTRARRISEGNERNISCSSVPFSLSGNGLASLSQASPSAHLPYWNEALSARGRLETRLHSLANSRSLITSPQQQNKESFHELNQVSTTDANNAIMDKQFASIWAEACHRYTAVTGTNLADLPLPSSAEACLSLVEEKQAGFWKYRERSAKIRSAVSPALKTVELFSDLVGAGASTAFPPSSAIFGAVTKLLGSAKNVSSAYDNIIKLFEDLKAFVTRLQVHSKHEISPELKLVMAQKLALLMEILALCAKMIQEGRGLRFFKTVLRGDDEELDEAMKQMTLLSSQEDSLVQALSLSAAYDNSGSLANITQEVSTVGDQVQQVLKRLEAFSTPQLEPRAMLSTLKDTLNPLLSVQTDYKNISGEVLKGTCEWFLQDPLFEAWLDGPEDAWLLWVSGAPGLGKSHLSARVVKKLLKLFPEDTKDQDAHNANRKGVGYFFCRETNENLRSVEANLKTIAYQIARSNKVYLQYATAALEEVDHLDGAAMVWEILFEKFFADEGGIDKSYIVIDGLDEALRDGYDGVEGLLKILKRFSRSSVGKSRLRILLVGRPELDDMVTEDGSVGHVPMLHLEQRSRKDVEKYVKHHIKHSKVLKKVSKQLRDDIVSRLSDKSFLWVKLLLKEMDTKSRESQIREAMMSFPKGLHATIQHVIDKFSETEGESVRDLNQALAWVMYAGSWSGIEHIEGDGKSLKLLDDVFKASSPDGESLIDVEDLFRRRWSTFFTLQRDDGITTGDLLALRAERKKDVSEDSGLKSSLRSMAPLSGTGVRASSSNSSSDESDSEDDLSSLALSDDDIDDLNDPTPEFHSPKQTTLIRLSHLSFAKFFMNQKTRIPDSKVGVYQPQAELRIFILCINTLLREGAIEFKPLSGFLATGILEHFEDRWYLEAEPDEKVAVMTALYAVFGEGKGTIGRHPLGDLLYSILGPHGGDDPWDNDWPEVRESEFDYMFSSWYNSGLGGIFCDAMATPVDRLQPEVAAWCKKIFEKGADLRGLRKAERFAAQLFRPFAVYCAKELFCMLRNDYCEFGFDKPQLYTFLRSYIFSLEDRRLFRDDTGSGKLLYTRAGEGVNTEDIHTIAAYFGIEDDAVFRTNVAILLHQTHVRRRQPNVIDEYLMQARNLDPNYVPAMWFQGRRANPRKQGEKVILELYQTTRAAMELDKEYHWEKELRQLKWLTATAMDQLWYSSRGTIEEANYREKAIQCFEEAAMNDPFQNTSHRAGLTRFLQLMDTWERYDIVMKYFHRLKDEPRNPKNPDSGNELDNMLESFYGHAFLQQAAWKNREEAFLIEAYNNHKPSDEAEQSSVFVRSRLGEFYAEKLKDMQNAEQVYRELFHAEREDRIFKDSEGYELDTMLLGEVYGAKEQLGQLYYREAQRREKDGEEAKSYVEKLEQISKPASGRGATVYNGRYRSTRCKALLGSWYRRHNLAADAENNFRALISESIKILQGLSASSYIPERRHIVVKLFAALACAGDYINARAIYETLVQKPLLGDHPAGSTLKSRPERELDGDDETEDELVYTNKAELSHRFSNRNYDSRDVILETHACSGDGCGRLTSLDRPYYVCVECFDVAFCTDCLRKLKRGKAVFNTCEKDHEWIKISCWDRPPTDGSPWDLEVPLITLKFEGNSGPRQNRSPSWKELSSHEDVKKYNRITIALEKWIRFLKEEWEIA